MDSTTAQQYQQADKYRDPKRYSWVFSLLVPMVTLLGPLLYFSTQNAALLWTPIIILYGVMPIVDFLLGADTSNPPESAVQQLEADPFYRYITYALVPLLWGAFLFGAWFVGTQNLPWYGVLPVAVINGLICGFGLNVGHELGHKKTTLERSLAKFVLAMGAYGHFFIEHNKGHHRDVATPEDPASSRMGETIYSFVQREIPGAFKRAWALEQKRLAAAGKSVWSLENEILQPALISLVLYTVLFALFGWVMLPFLLIVIGWGAFQLTSANYIEHYGLLRKRLEDGRYERCQPHHSWNSNHRFSNWAVFHLQRHSDHHANAARRYQSLRHFDNLPQLPNGYFGMFILAYIPPLWFHVMDKRLLQQVGGDVSKINMLEDKRDQLINRYHLFAA